MAATREDVIEFLKSMTLLEASQLVKELEETFGVSAAAAAVAAPAAGAERSQGPRRSRSEAGEGRGLEGRSRHSPSKAC